MTYRTKENVKYSIATYVIEKLMPSQEVIRICKRVAEGRISGDKAVEQIKHKDSKVLRN